MVRIGHSLLAYGHVLWQYVDELLAWLDKVSCPLWASLSPCHGTKQRLPVKWTGLDGASLFRPGRFLSHQKNWPRLLTRSIAWPSLPWCLSKTCNHWLDVYYCSLQPGIICDLFWFPCIGRHIRFQLLGWALIDGRMVSCTFISVLTQMYEWWYGKSSTLATRNACTTSHVHVHILACHILTSKKTTSVETLSGVFTSVHDFYFHPPLICKKPRQLLENLAWILSQKCMVSPCPLKHF